jgi:hypothetical protein
MPNYHPLCERFVSIHYQNQTTSPRRQGTRHQMTSLNLYWIPAFAGMTVGYAVSSSRAGIQLGAKLDEAEIHRRLGQRWIGFYIYC